MSRGGGAPTSETSDLVTPAPCSLTLWSRLPGIPALTPSAPGPAGAPVSSQLFQLPPVLRAPKLLGVQIRHCRNNGDSRRQRGDGSVGDSGGKGRNSSSKQQQQRRQRRRLRRVNVLPERCQPALSTQISARQLRLGRPFSGIRKSP
ncbi:hypothetical protein HJG60_011512 [Phyllostomus discolor]|uniref:Uncharacterized protein n=1 Tax=Phyllostomus discolor TaxID=89673 RepID=A0A834DXE2_9CHIR|nr:hypothetical protein HJG60_011512 [Phyllostomus discolor]